MAADNRKIVAILFSDVVGYAHVSDPEKTAPILHDEATRKLVRSLTQQYGGDWVHEIGDAVVCTFASAVAATQCALEIQQGIAAECEFRPRIGIHVGGVAFRPADIDTNLFSDAVNVAARVQGLSERGGICITGRVHEELRSNQALLDFDDLGEVSLDNVAAPTRVYRIELPMKSVTLSEFIAAKGRLVEKRSMVPTIVISIAVLIAVTIGWLLVEPAQEVTVERAESTGIPESNRTDVGAEIAPDSAPVEEVSEEEVRAAAFATAREKLRRLDGTRDFAARVWTIPDPVKNDAVYHVGIDADCACTALLFAIDGSAHEISLLYPNPFHRDGSIQAGEVLKIPSSGEFSLRAVGGEGIDEMKLIVVDGPLALGVWSGVAWSATPEQTERVAELETFLATIETLEWDSAAAPLQIVP